MTDAVCRQLTSGGSFFWRWAPARLDEAEMMWIIFCKLPPLRWCGNVPNTATCFAKTHSCSYGSACLALTCTRSAFKPWPGQTRTWKVLWQATTPPPRSYRWSSVLFDTLRRLSQIEIDFHCWRCERLAYCLFETSTSWKGLTTQTPLLKCSLNVMNLGGGGRRK